MPSPFGAGQRGLRGNPALPHRFNDVFGRTQIFSRFRSPGESAGWPFYYL